MEFAHVTVHRVDDIIGGQGLAIVEFNALADLEGPLGSAVIRQNFFGKLGLVTQLLGQAGQRAVIHATTEVVESRGVQGRIERVVRAMLVTGEHHAATALGRVGPGIGDTGEQCPEAAAVAPAAIM